MEASEAVKGTQSPEGRERRGHRQLAWPMDHGPGHHRMSRRTREIGRAGVAAARSILAAHPVCDRPGA